MGDGTKKKFICNIFSLFLFCLFLLSFSFLWISPTLLVGWKSCVFFCCHYSNTEFRSRFFLHGGLVHHNLLTGFAVTTLDKIYVSILVFMHLFPYLSIHPFIPTFISFPVTIASLHHSPILFFYYIFRSLVFFFSNPLPILSFLPPSFISLYSFCSKMNALVTP